MIRPDRRKFLGLAAGFLAAPALIRSAAAEEHFANPGVYYVNIENFAFNPSVVVINRYDIVRFTNYDGQFHTATENQGVFDTGALEQNQYAEIQFLEFGSFSYYCELHPHMTGTVNVI